MLFIIGIQAGKDITGKKGEAVKIDKGIGEVNPQDLDALLIPSGFSPDLLREDNRFGEFVNSQKHLYKKVNLFLPFAMAHKY